MKIVLENFTHKERLMNKADEQLVEHQLAVIGEDKLKFNRDFFL